MENNSSSVFDSASPTDSVNDVPDITAVLSLTASVTSSAFQAISTALNGTFPDYPGEGNSTSPFDPSAGEIHEGSYFLNTLIGLVIVLVASLLNALGLNLTKLDHTRQQAIPRRQRRKEYMRVLWLAGMGTYIASQVFGSPLALRYLRPDWVAPLGSSALVFNFLFAYWLVGTPVTPADIRGTVVIVLGVILIMVFSSINHGLSQSLSVHNLNHLWTRPSWLAFFVFLLIFTTFTYLVSSIFHALVSSRASFSPLPSPSIELRPSHPKPPSFFSRLGMAWKRVEGSLVSRLDRLFAGVEDAKVTWLEGIGWGVTGGSLAGMCLVFTKAVVKITALPGNAMLNVTPIITLLLVIFTAVLQIVCLNRALVCADTVVVVPLFYAGYTVFGFINSLIFYNQTKEYARWVLIAVFLSIAVLITGVVLLSLKSSSKAASDPYTVSTEPASSMRLRPQRPRSQTRDLESNPKGANEDDGDKSDKVMWEVGSVSDGSDDEGKDQAKGRGVGGSKSARGERRGLLGDEDEEGDEGKEREGPFGDDKEEEGFGDYEGVGADDLDEDERQGIRRK